MADYEAEEFPSVDLEAAPKPPQEKRLGYLALAFLLGAILPFILLPILNARTRSILQADAIKAGHAVYKVTDEFGHTKFEWVPVPGVPAPEKK